MKISFDTDARTCTVDRDGTTETHDLFSKQVFVEVADLWVRLGWVQKYSYGFSWLGRPIIQLPDDMLRIQEAIWQVKPDVIIETGIAHGGSLIFYASIMEMMGHGRVIGIDIDIRPHNRAAIEDHPMAKRITMIEGSSIADDTVNAVKALIAPNETVMLILDSNHARDHVAAELAAYAGLVTPGSYILSQDGVMQLVAGMPRTSESWTMDNPIPAVESFLAEHPDFSLELPPRVFDETLGTPECSHHPIGWLRRYGKPGAAVMDQRRWRPRRAGRRNLAAGPYPRYERYALLHLPAAKVVTERLPAQLPASLPSDAKRKYRFY
jgi:cephalosporin hydroxylase